MRNERDVILLQEIIRKQNKKGALMMDNLSSRSYVWNKAGRLVELDLSDRGLKGALDLSGFDALETLYCGNNHITSLDISGCPHLTKLYCWDNALEALDVSTNRELKYLICAENLLMGLDLVDHPVLTALVCYRNRLTHLDVSGAPALVQLNCRENPLKELDMSGCPLLADLSCEENLRIKRKGLFLDDCISRSGVLRLIDELGYVNCHDGRDYAANSRMDKIRQCIVEMPSFDMDMEEEKEIDYEK